MDFFAHKSSYIDEGADVGAETKIWHFCHVMDGARIGQHCSLGQNVFVAKGVVIGDFVKIQNNVSIYEGVTLEDYVFCGPSMVFTNVRTPRSAFPRNTSDDFLPTVVKYGTTVGANATSVWGVTIGKWASIGAGAVVTKDVPDYGLVVGVPARLIGWSCECGSTIKFVEQHAQCTQCDQQFIKKAPQIVERIES